MSLIAYLQRKRVPRSALALIDMEENCSITYGEFWSQIDKLALGLNELGVRANDRVALALPNGIAWVVSFLAILKNGAIVVPIHQRATAIEVKHLLRHCKPALFVGDSSFINKTLPFDLVSDRKQIVICSKRFMSRFSAQRITVLDGLMERTNGRKQLAVLDDDLQVASINYTYRGYGYPLGAMLSHRNYIHGIKGYIHSVGLHEGQLCLLALPLSHIYALIGSLLSPLACGSSIIIVRNPTPQKIWLAISRYRPNVLTGVPGLYSSLLRYRDEYQTDLSCLEDAICGGSLMPIPLYEEIQDTWRISLRQGYGLTECLPVIINPSSVNRPETLGKPGLGVSMKIFGQNDGEEAPVGKVGEIAIGGSTVMAGYYMMPKETAEVKKNGWFYTGDYGWLDAQGYLHFSGVKKRIAKVAGNTVDLTEVENELLAYPGVFSTDIYTLPDEKLGQVVCADVTCRSRSRVEKVTKDKIRQHLKKRLASYKIPRIRVFTK